MIVIQNSKTFLLSSVLVKWPRSPGVKRDFPGNLMGTWAFGRHHSRFNFMGIAKSCTLDSQPIQNRGINMDKLQLS